MVRKKRTSSPDGDTGPGRIQKILAGLAFLSAPLLALHACASTPYAPDWLAPWNGMRAGKLALSQVKVSQADGRLSIEVPEPAEAMARNAYAKEPLSSEALTVLALSDGRADAQTLEAAFAMNKRNKFAGALLLQIAVEEGNTAKVVDLVDILARVDPELGRELTGALTQGLSDDASIAIIENALQDAPPWANAFWRKVPQDEAALTNYIRLRKKLPAAATGESDAIVIRRLVEQGAYEQAFAFRKDTAKSVSEGGYPPLDWQWSRSSMIAASPEDVGTVAVFVNGGSAGLLGSRLIALGESREDITLDLNITSGRGNVSVALTCEKPGRTAPPGATAIEGALSLSPGNSDQCDFGWISLWGSALDSSTPLRAELRGLMN